MDSSSSAPREVTTREQAEKLQRGELVSVTGTGWDGEPLCATGYVVIVCRVTRDANNRPGPDAPLAVTVNAQDAYRGEPSAEATVILGAPMGYLARLRVSKDDPARHGTLEGCERCHGGTVCTHVAQTLTLTVEVDVRRASGPALPAADILAALRNAIEGAEGFEVNDESRYTIDHVDYSISRTVCDLPDGA
jgi:hypothetical protein